eukprot:10828961-Heterocapsa_arctica.AAC.1
MSQCMSQRGMWQDMSQGGMSQGMLQSMSQGYVARHVARYVARTASVHMCLPAYMSLQSLAAGPRSIS